MPKELDLRPQLRLLLLQALQSARREALLLAIAAVVLTPALFGLAALLLIWALLLVPGIVTGSRRLLHLLSSQRAFLSGIQVFLLVAIVGSVLHLPRAPAARRAAPWLLGQAVLAFGLACAISCKPSLLQTHACLGAALHGLLVLWALACLGRLHEPREDDNPTAWEATADNPLSLRDNLVRGRAALGLATLAPALLVETYLEVLGSVWVLRPLSRQALAGAVEALAALGDQAPERAREALRAPRNGPAALRLLCRLGYVVPASLHLTEAGATLVSAARLSTAGARPGGEAGPRPT